MESSVIGRVIDNNHYRITAILGRGGMGIVYKARNLKLNKDVALKVMDTNLALNETFLRRFNDEALNQALLENSNIVAVYDLLETDMGTCIVMEFVDGDTLADKIRELGPLPTELIFHIFKQVLTAIDHAHKSSIIHRDIKPSNIMLTKQSVVKVTDFGLAKNQQSSSNQTKTAMGGGTLFYMSAEQIRGLGQVDCRGDIYSLGMTLYESLTGALPFKDSDSEYDIQQKIVEGRVPPPDRIKPDLPKDMVKLVVKAIDKDPVKRFQSATEMLAALEKCETIAKAQVKQGESGRTKVVSREMPPKSRARWHIATLAVVLTLIGYLSWQMFFPLHAFISITTDPPGSEVFVNGKKIGTTPLVNYEVAAGELPMQIQQQQYFTIDSSFVVEPGESRTLVLTMKKIPEPSPSVLTGSLQITSIPPGADLFIDGQPTGKTPVTIERIGAATHAIQLRREGFRDLDSTLSISQGQNVIFEGRMVGFEATGRLQITSDPPGAAILIDGRPAGIAPLTVEKIREGTHRIQLTQNGFKDFVSPVKVFQGQTSTIDGKLDPQATGSVEITSVPSGAEIYIDGKESGKTPSTIGRLTTGGHSITLKQSGFKDFATNVTLSPERPEKIDANLVALMGTLEVRVRPFGSIYLDDKLLQADTPSRIQTSAQAGTHRLKARHPAYGIWEKQVTVIPDASIETLFDFDKMCLLSISVIDETGQPLRGDIYVDGKFTDKYAPGQIEVRPGARMIEIRSKKYVSVEAPRVLTVEKDQPLKFILKKLE